MLQPSSRLGHLVRLPLKAIPPESVLPVLSGPNRGAKWRVGSGIHGCWLGSYERSKARLFADNVRTGDVVVDVGAQAGYYTLIAARQAGRTGRVIAVEPLPQNIRALRSHIALNALGSVEVIEAAAGNKRSIAQFETGDTVYQGRVSAAGTLEVAVVTLDELLKERGLVGDIVKMDIEGGEEDALSGAGVTLDSARVVFVATHSDALQKACMGSLKSKGFSVSELDGRELMATRISPTSK